MNIQLVKKGDVIVEGNGKIEVRKVEHNACSKPSVHINGNACYDSSAEVVVRKGAARKDIDADEPAGYEVGVVRVENGHVDEDDMDALMSNIMAIADRIVRV